MDYIGVEWEKMIHGQEVDENVISPVVNKSWLRCIKAGVDPYKIDEKIFLKKEEIDYYKNSPYIKVDKELLLILQKIADKFDLSFLIFDNKCKLVKILACSEKIQNIASDSSENIIGTNSICLAIIHKMPIQVFGKEHYNKLLHQYNCSAAPIHDSNNNIIGVINIGGIITYKHTVGTLGLAQSIAKIIEERIHIDNMIAELRVSNETLKNIIEFDSSGIIYLVNDKVISYNKSLLNMFEISYRTKSNTVNKSIKKILNQVEKYLKGDETESGEIVLNINNSKKSFIVSVKKFNINEKKEYCRLYKFDNTDKYMHININNKAVYNFDDIIGNCENIVRVKELAKKASRTSSPILINGESGTGKELFAQSIHNESFRRNKPFVAINCGAIPSELIESELFGYEPGAFTGAANKIKFGKLEVASGGTFFFDEIESMPLNVQIKLLRAISSKKITRIGGIKEIPIDIRIIAATKKDLLEEVEIGNFREDLYFRINTIILTIPPLRDRKDDIPLLAKSFIDYIVKHSDLQEVKVDPQFYEALKYYYWRGNVRELRNVIARSVLLNEKEILSIDSLPREVVSAYKYKTLKNKVLTNISEDQKNKSLLKTGEEIIIEYVLNEENWNLTKAAKRLGISRPTLYKKIEESHKLKKRKDKLH